MISNEKILSVEVSFYNVTGENWINGASIELLDRKKGPSHFRLPILPHALLIARYSLLYESMKFLLLKE